MPFPPDYHMHTPLCRHASGEPVQYAAQALSVGLHEIGFSDHSPMEQDDFDNWRMLARQLPEYIAKVEAARQQYPRLQIKLGLEVDYLPGHEAWIQHLASQYPWDYLIGSVHYIAPSWDIDNPEKLSLWNEQPSAEVWTAYFDRLTQAAASGLFDILGHADLCKKFGFYPLTDPTQLYTRFLDAARQSDTAIEINTAGLRKDCREIYPSPTILQLAAERHVPITFGSDAHKPSEVGHAFPQAVHAALESGHSHFCTFTQRTRHLHPISEPVSSNQ